MEKNNQLQQISQRAERLFAKKSYAAAQKEFERILVLSPNENIRDKIRVCEEELLLQQRKDQIKKGRRLEKKGDLASALDCFTQASTTQTESWLDDKILQLRQRLESARLASIVEEAAQEQDLEKRLSAYERALASGANDPELMDKRIGCLVEMGRYEQAIDLYANHTPQSIQGRYDFGYALIACGRYLQGLMQWEPLLPGRPALLPRIMAFLPCLARELSRLDRGYALPYRILSDPEIFGPGGNIAETNELLDQYRRYFYYCYLKELWHTEDYARIPELLPSPPRLRDVPLLARLYLNLAETDVEYLRLAITYWLTVIHNRKSSDSPRVEEIASNPATSQTPPDDSPSDNLLAPLEEQIATHTRSGRVTPDLKAHWQTERQRIESLAIFLDQKGRSLSVEEKGERKGGGKDPADNDENEYLLCTPAFAREFDLCDKILRFLRDRKGDADIDEGGRLELHAAYSPLGRYMDWIEPGSEEKIFKALPKSKTPDPETDYLRQRIALRCGINRIYAGGRHARKFFQAALPILASTPHLPRELIELAYAEPSKEVISSLSEAMEFLASHIKEPRFLQATAHCIGIDVQNLLLQGGGSADVMEKRLNLGLAIYPDAQQIQATLSLVLKEKNARKINKALNSGNLQKAARIVLFSEDVEMENMFFDAMEAFYSQLLAEYEEHERGAFLHRIYEACRIVDEQHWLTEQLADECSM
uniref:Tetratricopeptide repeat-containing protein n=1 Tax=Candidatus Kentrum sp. LPFa TaxID=2126335 RepID=A0A450VZN3_9GAMM|nr:MAG: hypothetical protein BECKLPF1236B_GA0070989_10144 [Candidatus Kentron sp. LPFa]